MQLRLTSLLFTLCLSGAAAAGGVDPIATIAGDHDLREREVRMLAGAPSAFAEYRTSYRRLAQAAAARGLDLRSRTVIARHARELDRAVAFSLKAELRRMPASAPAIAGR
jgi:hypothetical protein